jgi:vancomycin resistance protein YoaR
MKPATQTLAFVPLALVCGLAVATFRSLPSESTLAGFATPLAGRTKAQRHNAYLAALKLNGAVIARGAVFSFHDRVGTFSRDQGYRRAPVSYNGQLIDDWGGGVCQVSTTLYNAALLADMKIEERNRHRFCPSYVPPGRDAAVAFSDIDLRFRNPHPFQVRIHSRLEGEHIYIELVGDGTLSTKPQITQVVTQVQEPETFFVGHPGPAAKVRNTGKIGFDVCVYRIHGNQRELISHDLYPAMNRVVQYRQEKMN